MADALSSPVIGRGEINWGDKAKLTRPRAGVAIVLTGRSGVYREVTPNTPISVWDAWRGKFTHYVEVDTSERVGRDTQKCLSGEAPFSFIAEIEVKARILSAEVFLQTYGLTAALVTPFYNELLRDIEHFLAGYHPDAIGAAKQTLDQLGSQFEKSKQIWGGVRLQGLRVSISHDPEYIHQSLAAQAAMLLDRYGPNGIALQKLANPNHAALLEAYLRDLTGIATKTAELNDLEWKRSVARIQELIELGIIDREEGRQFLHLDKLRDIGNLVTPKQSVPIVGKDGPERFLPRPATPDAQRRLPGSDKT
jgi:hypothetical protein